MGRVDAADWDAHTAAVALSWACDPGRMVARGLAAFQAIALGTELGDARRRGLDGLDDDLGTKRPRFLPLLS
jgi:hypothetical protein